MKTLWELLRDTIVSWIKGGSLHLAAALSFYTMLSFAPLLIVIVAIAGFFLGDQAARGEVVSQIQSIVGVEGANFVQTAIKNASINHQEGYWTTIGGIILLLFGATGVFSQIQRSLNQIWNVESTESSSVIVFVTRKIISFGLILGVGFILLLSLIISALVAILSQFVSSYFDNLYHVVQISNFALNLIIVTLLVSLIFRYLPDAKLAWKEIWIGASVTTFLFLMGKYLIGLYIGNSSITSIYGSAASLALILVWVYYSSVIFFLGAEFTKVYSNKFGSRILSNRNKLLL